MGGVRNAPERSVWAQHNAPAPALVHYVTPHPLVHFNIGAMSSRVDARSEAIPMDVGEVNYKDDERCDVGAVRRNIKCYECGGTVQVAGPPCCF